ncbi:MAG TPA: nucleoside hydrolase [Bacteroidales bacterium]|nr:nucleoside hydrolase [Bacteroidales bacterium]
MNSFKNLLFLVLALGLFQGCTPEKYRFDEVSIIFDTDFGPDYDDVGALAFLHAMADSGKAEILATISCNQHELVGPGIDVLNTWFGRSGLPIGAPKAQAVNLGSWQHWLDTLDAKYPHRVRSTSELPDAVDVYRKTLYAQPDTSVTIVTVGFLTNLADLLRSGPDSICPLTGADLVSLKVKRLVAMAGKFPDGREFNVHMDSLASKHVFENWPTPVIFTGFEIGWEIRTGLRLIRMSMDNNPVKDVFQYSIPLAAEDSLGRMSWDETAVLIAVYGTKGFFTTVPGRITVNSDGSNGWINDPQGKHVYVVQEMPVDQMSRFIEDRMMHIPVKTQ